MVEVNKDATFMDISTNTPLSYDWNFGDGTVLTGITLNPITHKYTTEGNYTVTHKVYNACGPSTNTCTQTVAVTPQTTPGGSSSGPVIATAAILGLMMLKKR